MFNDELVEHFLYSRGLECFDKNFTGKRSNRLILERFNRITSEFYSNHSGSSLKSFLPF